MEKWFVRAAYPDDAPALSALIQNTLRTTNAADYAPEVIEKICAHFTPEQVHQKLAAREVFAALADGTIAGTASFAGNRLLALYVAPSFQGQGVGACLVRHIETLAVARGLEELWLSSSLTARGFYERLGYHMQKLEDWGAGDVTWLMRKGFAGQAGNQADEPASHSNTNSDV